jgi:hypothetical protein
LPPHHGKLVAQHGDLYVLRIGSLTADGITAAHGRALTLHPLTVLSEPPLALPHDRLSSAV